MQPKLAIISDNLLEKQFTESSMDTEIRAFYKSHSIQIDVQIPAKEVRMNGSSILLINRQKTGLARSKAKCPPHEIDYKSILVGIYQAGIKKIVSVNMCGSLQKETPPGSMTILSDFIDFVNRDITLDDLGQEVADMAAPFDPRLCQTIKKSAGEGKIPLTPDSTYVLCVDGSRLETPAEIEFLRKTIEKNVVVGMEVPTEAQIAKLLGISYAAICIVTNYATGMRKNSLTQSLIEGVFEKSVPSLSKLILGIVNNL